LERVGAGTWMGASWPSRLGLGDRILLDGRPVTVSRFDDGRVWLRSDDGAERSLTLLQLLTESFELLAPAPPPGANPYLMDSPLARARFWESHLAEVLTGLPATAPAKSEPRPTYDLSRTSLVQREASKAAELAALVPDMAVSVGDVRRMRQRFADRGFAGLVDPDPKRERPLGARMDPKIREALTAVLVAHAQLPVRPASYYREQTGLSLAARHGLAGVPELPSLSTFRRLLARIGYPDPAAMAAGASSFAASGGFDDTGAVLPPGERVWVRTADLRLDASGPAASPLLARATVALDEATGIALAVLVHPEGTAVDGRALVARMCTPLGLRPRAVEVAVGGDGDDDERVLAPNAVVLSGGYLERSASFLEGCNEVGLTVLASAEASALGTSAGVDAGILAIIQQLSGPLAEAAGAAGRGALQDPEAFFAAVQPAVDRWAQRVWQRTPYPHGPARPEQPLSPIDAYDAWITRTGCVDLPLPAGLTLPLLPSAWRRVDDEGVRLRGLRYNGTALDDARSRSGEAGAVHGGRAHVYADPFDVRQVWLHGEDGSWHALGRSPGTGRRASLVAQVLASTGASGRVSTDSGDRQDGGRLRRTRKCARREGPQAAVAPPAPPGAEGLDEQLSELAQSSAAQLVKAMLAERWAEVRGEVGGLLARGQDAGVVIAELEEARAEVAAAQRSGDVAAVGEVETEWRSRLRRLLRAEPQEADRLRMLAGEPEALRAPTGSCEPVPVAGHAEVAEPAARRSARRAPGIRCLEEGVGVERIASQFEDALRLTRACGAHVVALRIVVAKLCADSDLSLGALAQAVEEELDRLPPQLRRQGLRDARAYAVRNLAYFELPTDRARLYRLLGLLPHDDYPASTVAAAAQMSEEAAQDHLEQLLQVGLLPAGWFSQFQLFADTRAHARVLSEIHDPAVCEREVLARLLDHYVQLTSLAQQAESSGRFRITPLCAPPPGKHPFDRYENEPSLRERARAWLSWNRAAVMAALRAGGEHRLDRQVWQVTEMLGLIHSGYGSSHERRKSLERGVDAAVRDARPDAEAQLRCLLAQELSGLEHDAEARQQLQRASVLTKQGDNLPLEASVQEHWGHYWLQRDPKRAKTAFLRCLRLSRRAEDPHGVAVARYHLGRAQAAAGDTPTALETLSRAITELDSCHDQPAAALALAARGQEHARSGDLALAHEDLEQAVSVLRDLHCSNERAQVQAVLDGILEQGAEPRAPGG
jgi:tetratricopeptide (TPR) repeat protein